MEGTMMGLVCHEGGRLELMERPAPKIQQPGDAVVRVTLSTICTSDLHIMRGAVPRAKSETILGHEFVGVVEETGSEVTSLKPGDRVAANCIRIYQQLRKGRLGTWLPDRRLPGGILPSSLCGAGADQDSGRCLG